ncbi:MAG TPA: hypothetical protein VIL35_07850 [Vicinamibacterales bacterium]
MRFVRSVVPLLIVCSFIGTGRASAQVPDTGMLAAGGEFGFFAPDDEFELAPIIGGLFEYYPLPRLGLRGSVMFTNPEFDRGPDDNLSQTRLGFDVIYNWERGAWHPFAGGGIGIHMLELEENGRDIADSNEAGFSILGGVEYFFRRRTTFKIEGRIQFVDEVRFADPSGFAATFGIKHYF